MLRSTEIKFEVTESKLRLLLKNSIMHVEKHSREELLCTYNHLAIKVIKVLKQKELFSNTCSWFCSLVLFSGKRRKSIKEIYILLPPIRAAEIVECVRKYVDGISQNLQSLSPYQPSHPPVFSFLPIVVKQVKSSSQICRYQQVNQY